MDRTLLILDLDETLIFATRESIGKQPDFGVLDYFVHKRPYLDRFLNQIFDLFKVAVWSSAGVGYAGQFVPRIFPDPGATSSPSRCRGLGRKRHPRPILVRFPGWTAAKTLRHGDRSQVQTTVTSLSTPGVWFGDASACRRPWRACRSVHRAGSVSRMAVFPRADAGRSGDLYAQLFPAQTCSRKRNMTLPRRGDIIDTFFPSDMFLGDATP